MEAQHQHRYRFTVSLPLYIQSKDADGQDVVLYRLNVLLQPLDGQQQLGSSTSAVKPPPFFVLRRYNQFRSLYAQLKGDLPDIMQREKGLAPPPKHALNLKGAKDMLDRRREDLENWLWRLLSKPAIARSAALRSFLELDRAIQRANSQMQQHYGGTLLPPGSPTSSIASMPQRQLGLGDWGSLDRLQQHQQQQQQLTPGSGRFADTASDVGDPDAEVGMLSGSMHNLSRYLLHSEASSSIMPAHQIPGSQQRSSQSCHVPHVANSAPSTAGLRLGLRFESRGHILQLVEELQGRLAQACKDLHAAASEYVLLSETNRLMGARMVELETSQQGPMQKKLQQLEKELAAARAESSRLGHSSDASQQQEQQQQQGDAVSQLEAVEEVEELRSALSASEAIRLELSGQLARAEEDVAGKVQLLLSQVEQLQQQLAEARTDNAGLLARMHEWRVNSRRGSATGDRDASSLQHEPGEGESHGNSSNALAQLRASEASRTKALQELAAVTAKLERERAQWSAQQVAQAEEVATLRKSFQAEWEARVQERSKARGDQTLLAKEIKRLREELAAQVRQATALAAPAGTTTVSDTPTCDVQQREQVMELHQQAAAQLQDQAASNLTLEKQKVQEQATELGSLKAEPEQARQHAPELAKVQPDLAQAPQQIADQEAAASQLSVLHAELQQARHQVAEHTALNSEVTSVRAELAEVQQQLTQAQLQLGSSAAESPSVHAELSCTPKQLESSAAELSSVRAELAEVQGQLEAVKNSAAQLADSHSGKAGAQQLAAQVAVLSAELAEARQQVAAMQEQQEFVQELQRQDERLQDELQLRQQQLQSALDAQQRLQAEVHDLRALLQQQTEQQLQHKSVSARTSFEAGRQSSTSANEGPYSQSPLTESLLRMHTEAAHKQHQQQETALALHQQSWMLQQHLPQAQQQQHQPYAVLLQQQQQQHQAALQHLQQHHPPPQLQHSQGLHAPSPPLPLHTHPCTQPHLSAQPQPLFQSLSIASPSPRPAFSPTQTPTHHAHAALLGWPTHLSFPPLSATPSTSVQQQGNSVAPFFNESDYAALMGHLPDTPLLTPGHKPLSLHMYSQSSSPAHHLLPHHHQQLQQQELQQQQHEQSWMQPEQQQQHEQSKQQGEQQGEACTVSCSAFSNRALPTHEQQQGEGPVAADCEPTQQHVQRPKQQPQSSKQRTAVDPARQLAILEQQLLQAQQEAMMAVRQSEEVQEQQRSMSAQLSLGAQLYEGAGAEKHLSASYPDARVAELEQQLASCEEARDSLARQLRDMQACSAEALQQRVHQAEQEPLQHVQAVSGLQQALEQQQRTANDQQQLAGKEGDLRGLQHLVKSEEQAVQQQQEQLARQEEALSSLQQQVEWSKPPESDLEQQPGNSQLPLSTLHELFQRVEQAVQHHQQGSASMDSLEGHRQRGDQIGQHQRLGLEGGSDAPESNLHEQLAHTEWVMQEQLECRARASSTLQAQLESSEQALGSLHHLLEKVEQELQQVKAAPTPMGVPDEQGSEHQALQEQLHHMRAMHAMEVQQLQQLHGEQQGLVKGHVQELQADLEQQQDLKQQVQRLQTELEQQQDLKQQLQQLQVELEETRGLQEQVQHLEAVCAAHAEQHQQLHHQLTASRYEAQQQQAQLKLVHAQLDEAHTQHAQLEEQLKQHQVVAQQKQQQRQQQEELKQSRPLEDGRCVISDDQRQQRGGSEPPSNPDAPHAVDLEGIVETQSRRIAFLQEELQRKGQQAGTLQSELQAKEAASKEASQHLASLRASLQAKDTKLDDLGHQIQQLQQQTAAKEALANDCTQQIHALKAALQQARNEVPCATTHVPAPAAAVNKDGTSQSGARGGSVGDLLSWDDGEEGCPGATHITGQHARQGTEDSKQSTDGGQASWDSASGAELVAAMVGLMQELAPIVEQLKQADTAGLLQQMEAAIAAGGSSADVAVDNLLLSLALSSDKLEELRKQVRTLLQGPNLLPPTSPAVAEVEGRLRSLLLELLLHITAQATRLNELHCEKALAAAATAASTAAAAASGSPHTQQPPGLLHTNLTPPPAPTPTSPAAPPRVGGAQAPPPPFWDMGGVLTGRPMAPPSVLSRLIGGGRDQQQLQPQHHLQPQPHLQQPHHQPPAPQQQHSHQAPLQQRDQKQPFGTYPQAHQQHGPVMHPSPPAQPVSSSQRGADNHHGGSNGDGGYEPPSFI